MPDNIPAQKAELVVRFADRAAGQPESRRYRARYRDDDPPASGWSDIVEVTAQG